jgi:hypothetical protein
MIKKTDIAHLFTASGSSVTKEKQLEEQVRKLTAENEDLKRRLSSQALRRQFIDEPSITRPTIH